MSEQETNTEEKKYILKGKEYQFIKPDYEFRIWGNYFYQKLKTALKPIEDLDNKRRLIAFKSNDVKKNIDLSKNEKENTEIIFEKWKNNEINLDAEFTIAQLKYTEQYNLILDDFLFGYVKETGFKNGMPNLEKIEGNYKQLLKSCLVDFDFTDFILDDETIDFVRQVLDGFFEKSRKRPLS